MPTTSELVPSVRSDPPDGEEVEEDAAPDDVLVEDANPLREALVVDAGALAVARVDAPWFSLPVTVLVAAAVAAACEEVAFTGAGVQLMPRSSPSRPSWPFQGPSPPAQRPSALFECPSSPPQRATLEEGAAETRQAAEKATNAEDNFMTQSREEIGEKEEKKKEERG